MPLCEKARIEVYLPDLPKTTYQNLLHAIEQEFTYTFGGATVNRGLDGSYLSHAGLHIRDRINLVYTDTPFALDDCFDQLGRFTQELRNAAIEALEEEAVLVAVLYVFHAE